MVAVIGADPVYNESSAADAATWTKTVADNPGTLGFVISMNTQAPGTGDSVKELVEATNDRAKLIKQASGDKLPVYCLMDWFGTDLSARNAIMKKFDACDLHIVVYLPLPHSKKYGNPAWTADAGTSARALDGTDSITVTQAMSWSHVDPQFAKDWGFPNSPAPAANQVAGMAKLGMRGIDDNRPGALRVLVFTLENKVGGTPDADDTKYLVGCGNAVYTQALS
jgi:hypothetical protein